MGKVLVIHVYDENRQLGRDFYCQKDHLQKYMLYFQPYLKEGQDFDDIDISVHCDVKIFDWLLRYVEFKEYTLKKLKYPNAQAYTE